MKLRLPSFIPLSAILGLAALVAGCLLAYKGSWLNQLYPLGAFIVGGFLYLRYPVHYVGFVWWLWFLTPEVRRLVDYQSGWHPQSTVMLAPYVVAGLTFFTLLRHSPKLPDFPYLPIGLASAGLFYGFGVGVLKVGALAAAFDLINWTVPVMVAFHLVVHWRDYPRYRRVTQHTFTWGVLVMGLYGLWQYFAPPVWDQVWMLNAPIGSIGSPEPLEVRVFSTLNSPGPFAVVMMAGLLVLFSGGGPLRWLAAVPGYASFLLSLVRSAWGAWVVGLFFLAAHRGHSRPRLLAALTVTVLIIWPLLSFGPIADAIDDRLQTIGALQQDTSFSARLRFYSEFAPHAFSNLLGAGLGRTGVATKLSSGGDLGQFGDFDSGIMAIPFVLGWPGGLLYAGGLVWLTAYALRRVKRPDLFVAASRGIVVAVLAQLVFGNVATGVSGTILWYFLGLAVAARLFHNRSVSHDGVA